jgi:uncharacterized membrane protein
MNFDQPKPENKAELYFYAAFLLINIGVFVIVSGFLTPLTYYLFGNEDILKIKETKEYILWSSVFLTAISFYWGLQLTVRIRQSYLVIILMLLGLIFIISGIYVYSFYKMLHRGFVF